jgi:surface antigen
MAGRIYAGALLALATVAGPVGARATIDSDDDPGGGDVVKRPTYLQCVPYARQVSGVQLYGDAHTWWDQAEGRYARGHLPRVGAVMAFEPHGNMRLGHVATVSKLVDSRTVLLKHANWSPIDGRRGQIENNVRAVDVSPDNDWSQVRVWFAPIKGLGNTAWPVEGFIYNKKPGKLGNLKVARTTAEKTRLVLALADKSGSGKAWKAEKNARLALPPKGSDPIGQIIARKKRY